MADERKSPVELDRERRRAQERAQKRASARPISSRRATPWVYCAAVFGGYLVVNGILGALGLSSSYHGAAIALLIVLGAILVGMLAYDPLLRYLDDRFSS